jgi:hypothetical protein
MTRALLALLVVLLSAPAQSAHGATVRLKNGNRLDGDVTVAEDGQVTIDIPGLGLLTFSKDEVAAIEEPAGPPVVEPSVGFAEDASAEATSQVIAEMSCRSVGISGSEKESGAAIRESPGRITIRSYRLAVNEATRAKHPSLFQDRTAQLTREEYEEVWLQMLEAVDVWNLQSEPAPKDPSAGLRCEATFKRGERSVRYVAYGTQQRPCWTLSTYDRINRIFANAGQAFGKREAEQRDGKPFGTYAFVRGKQSGSSR